MVESNTKKPVFISLQEIFEKRRRRRESHNAVERRRRDNINERIHGKYIKCFWMNDLRNK